MAHAQPKLRSASQGRAIWALAGQIAKAAGVDKDEIARAATQAASGQEHTSRLTEGQALRVIQHLQARLAEYAPKAPTSKPQPAPHQPWAPRTPGPRESLPMTAFQGVVLNGLFALCGMGGIGDRARFCRRQTGETWPRTQAEADKVITPLSAIAMRKVDGDDIRRRVIAMQGHVALDRWKTGFVEDLVEQLDGPDPKARLSPHKLLKILECEAAVAARGA